MICLRAETSMGWNKPALNLHGIKCTGLIVLAWFVSRVDRMYPVKCPGLICLWGELPKWLYIPGTKVQGVKYTGVNCLWGATFWANCPWVERYRVWLSRSKVSVVWCVLRLKCTGVIVPWLNCTGVERSWGDMYRGWTSWHEMSAGWQVAGWSVP